jgi:hypothetical protein
MKETYYYQELFDLMSNEHDLHLTKGQMDDIISVVNKMQVSTCDAKFEQASDDYE